MFETEKNIVATTRLALWQASPIAVRFLELVFRVDGWKEVLPRNFNEKKTNYSAQHGVYIMLVSSGLSYFLVPI